MASTPTSRLATIGLAILAGLACFPIWGQEPPGFRTLGRHLYDRCGERVILRGVNKMVVWTDVDGLPSYSEIAQTGANAVRIVWSTGADAAELDTAISNCIAHSMIPMVELHDATGDWSLLQSMVDYWVRPDVLAVLQKHEHVLLVNIANECGDWSVTDPQFQEGYTLAINRMREAGIHTPLVIDGSGWGHNIDQLQAVGPALEASDPDHNLVFSTHMYWGTGFEQFIRDELHQSATLLLPLIVGEFNEQIFDCTGGNPYRAILEQSQADEIGWLAWSWGPGNTCPGMDMTSNNTYASLHDWGLEVAVTHADSIQNTSVRPYSMVHGECLAAKIFEDGFENGSTSAWSGPGASAGEE